MIATAARYTVSKMGSKSPSAVTFVVDHGTLSCRRGAEGFNFCRLLLKLPSRSRWNGHVSFHRLSPLMARFRAGTHLWHLPQGAHFWLGDFLAQHLRACSHHSCLSLHKVFFCFLLLLGKALITVAARIAIGDESRNRGIGFGWYLAGTEGKTGRDSFRERITRIFACGLGAWLLRVVGMISRGRVRHGRGPCPPQGPR